MQKFSSVSICGLSGHNIDVEVDVARGIGQFNIVGLGDTAVQESRDRVRAAIKNSGLKFPSGSRITVNLAPADIRKKGPCYDLPIALGILSKECDFSDEIINNSLFIGELALDGSIRGVNGILPAVIFAREQGKKYFFLPFDNAMEANIIPDIQIIGVESLVEVVNFLSKKKDISEKKYIPEEDESHVEVDVDFSTIHGQEQAKRALIIAAAGGHNIILEGPPGSGKSMLSKAMAGILPDLELEEKIEVSEIYSVAGLLSRTQPLIHKRPFRTIHHTASEVSIIGGGRDSRPGEISLAHKGILFLDEFLEFPKSVLETLRQPMEDGKITINRIQQSTSYPAKFSLIAAMNPCPCGFLGDKEKACICTQNSIDRYRAKLSGPIMDRIDIFLTVPRIRIQELRDTKTNNCLSSKDIQNIVQKAKEKQKIRFQGTKFFSNADMDNTAIHTLARISPSAKDIAITSTEKLQLSTRVYYRILRLARTIADVEGVEDVEVRHIMEALSYRGHN